MRNERDNLFDPIRLLFALAVLYSHSFSVLEGDFAADGAGALGRMGVSPALLGVNGFFALSGYLVTASWLRSRGLFDYLKKRALRIYPGFVAASLLTLFVVAPLFSADFVAFFRTVSLPSLLGKIAMLRPLGALPVFAGNPAAHLVDAQLWTIRIEFECYLLVPLLALLGVLKRPPLALALAIGVTLVNAWLVRPSSNTWVSGMAHVRFFAYFLSGMVLCLYRERVRYPGWGALAAVGVLAAAGALGWYRAVAPLAWPYLILAVAQRPAPKWLHRLGGWDLSYGVYLYGFVVQQALVDLMGPQIHPLALFAASAVVSALLAAASWALVERPCLRLKDARPAPTP